MSKYVKLFEAFLSEAAKTTIVSEAAKTTIVTTKTIKLDKGIEDKVKLAADLSSELKKLSDEYNAKIKPMQDTLNKYDAEILEKLTALNINQAKVEKIIAKVMMSKGRLTDSYKTLWEEALKKVNDKTRAVLTEMQTANKKQNPDKYWMEYEKEKANEGLKEIAKHGKEFVAKLKTWVNSVWTKLKDAINGHEEAVENLEAVGNKITKK